MGRLRLIGQRIPTLRTARAALPPKVADEFYKTRQWVEFAAVVKQERGNKCEEPSCGYRGLRLIADHIIEVKDGGALLDRRNVKIRCSPCHNRKTAETSRLRALNALPPSKDGLPLQPNNRD
jgi:5-methylcytosine-specific restriction endonuclease McrA